MSKQKPKYSYARIRPTSQSNANQHSERSKQDQKKYFVFSNLLHNYQKIQSSPRIKTSQVKVQTARKINAFQLKFKPLDNKFPFEQYFLTQRNDINSLSKRQSNYSLYLQKSMSKRSNQHSQRFERTSKTTNQLSKSELLVPCKVSSIKIKQRSYQDHSNLKQLKESVMLRRKRRCKKSKITSEIILNKKYGDQTIEPWALKNYQSIVL